MGLGNPCHFPMNFQLSQWIWQRSKPRARKASVLILANSQSFDSRVQRATPGTALPTRLRLHTALFPPAWDAQVPGITEILQNWYKENLKCRLVLWIQWQKNTDESLPLSSCLVSERHLWSMGLHHCWATVLGFLPRDPGGPLGPSRKRRCPSDLRAHFLLTALHNLVILYMLRKNYLVNITWLISTVVRSCLSRRICL